MSFLFGAGGAPSSGATGAAFNPGGDDYDYQTAKSHGMGPTGTGENVGHWGSVAPASAADRSKHGLPDESYVVLKGRGHSTFDKAIAGEEERGFKIVKLGERYYSVPSSFRGEAISGARQ